MIYFVIIYKSKLRIVIHIWIFITIFDIHLYKYNYLRKLSPSIAQLVDRKNVVVNLRKLYLYI